MVLLVTIPRPRFTSSKMPSFFSNAFKSSCCSSSRSKSTSSHSSRIFNNFTTHFQRSHFLSKCPVPARLYGILSRSLGTKLSPNEVTLILRSNENTEDLSLGSVKSFDTNQLSSNSPIEDMRAEARCLLTTGLLFSVIDGHGGPSCAQVIAKRLFSYIAASLLPSDILHKLLNPNVAPSEQNVQLLESFNDQYDLVGDLDKLYETSYRKFLDELILQDQSTPNTEFNMRIALEKAFLRLDNDIQREARLLAHQSDSHSSGDSLSARRRPSTSESLFRKTLSIAESGAVAAVAHIDGEHLHVGSCGDCRVVLGTRPGDDVLADGRPAEWIAQCLTKEHNFDNVDEVKRVFSEHPVNEQDYIIRNERLLGQLAPFRAFGDVRFKWTKEEIRELLVPYMGEQAVISHSITPPYLTARPEVTYHRLRPKDSFIILASDGLWDMLSPSQAVRLVGEHMSGKTVLSPYKLPQLTGIASTTSSTSTSASSPSLYTMDERNRPRERESPKLGSIHETLLKRMESFKLKPIDSNAATHLIRHALGGTDAGLDHNRLSYYLTLPEDTVRFYRDDISVSVVFFDPDWLSQRPLIPTATASPT